MVINAEGILGVCGLIFILIQYIHILGAVVVQMVKAVVH